MTASPGMTPFDHLDTDFVASLHTAGIDPAAVDVVIDTHLHSDHVGWNPMRRDAAWVPTFPNARYVMPEADYRSFHPDNAANWPAPHTEAETGADRGVSAAGRGDSGTLPAPWRRHSWSCPRSERRRQQPSCSKTLTAS
ncbi:MBL fold metallo-hydrolase [Mycobacterium sp. NPDC048908]|uniref:MBL fold metallo-hydrolase n=1 Tax=Mycobacterium sp. NPDC048908 TaxID=3364292 RepID=UPI0037110C6D